MDDSGKPVGVSAVPSVRGTLRRRLAAAGSHLALSVVVFAVPLYLTVFAWYPGFHFAVDGGWQGVRIMAGVSLALGPLLTLIVFNPVKARRLIAFDLVCIAVIQIAALVWGFHAIYGQHPVAITVEDGEFRSVIAEPLQIESYPVESLASLSDRRPALVYIAPPANEDEEARAAVQALVGGVASHEDPFFFRAFAPHWAEVKNRAVPADQRAAGTAAFARELPRFLERHGGPSGDYAFFPYWGRYGKCTLAFTAAGEWVDVVGCEKL